MNPRRPDDAPPRMASDRGALGELLRAAQRYTPPLDQRAAFAKLVQRAQSQPRSWTLSGWALGLAAATAAIALAVGALHRSGGADPAAEHAATPLTEARPAAPNPALTSTTKPLSRLLPAGESRLGDGSRVHLSSSGSARLEDGPAGVRVGLDQGVISVDVAVQSPGRTFEVRAGPYRFVALGTAFSVETAGERVQLQVREGRVAVLRGSLELARVGAGQNWTPDGHPGAGRIEPAPARTAREIPKQPSPDPDESATLVEPEPPAAVKTEPEPATPAPSPVPSASERNCLELARARRPRDAERCFASQAASDGLSAELALFELSRLRSDVLGDPSGALSTLEQYRARFPNGSLHAEVDIALVHLLSRLGRHAQLLSETGRLLQAPTGREREGELRMLRAHAFRRGLQDFQSAEREYARVVQGGGKFALDALYYRALCLESLGDREGAAALYRRYLEVPGRRREAEVQRRLQALTH